MAVDVSAAETFGRHGAMFDSLLSFIAALSVVLWGIVLVTAVIRFVAVRVVFRTRRRVPAALTATVATAVGTTRGSTSARTPTARPAPALPTPRAEQNPFAGVAGRPDATRQLDAVLEAETVVEAAAVVAEAEATSAVRPRRAEAA
jgi:hypothetical protein